ncbi:HAMP domain-containing sensor histidine kinase [Corallococcus sp. bb12-1]|uniref:sensor histidine kinase n=1 Tax=Corallococcus sp. bb12-1 TaxID=2996784 RepID=UPI00227205A6|nr:HAMP domain-containing sensor histidine kinase [Corallococcus sp. bb12-1]MCY1043623.1 HAMP domain-containing sensor histidine kinase [Corallococcus sp. bb12-1]
MALETADATRSRGSMVHRLSRTMLAVALASSALTAGATGLLAYHMLLAGEDRRLRDAAVDLVEEVKGLGDATAAIEADAEQKELAAFGIRIALFSADMRLGGNPNVPVHSGCDWSQAPGGAGIRRCGEQAHGRLAVAEEQLESIPRLRLLLPLAAAIGASCAALISLLMSRRVARWAARPLTELSASLSGIEPGAPLPAPLLTEARYGEVDAVRVALVELLTRLHESLEHSRRFAANAAHELRTPLATLQADLELQAETSPPPEVARALERMHRTVTSLATLVERLMVLAQGAAPGTLELVDTVSLSQLVTESLRALPPDARQRVDVEAGTPGLIPGDSHLLRQLFDNVLENALKFSEGGRVRVRIHEDADATLLDMHDEGPGIAPEDAMRVFEPFYRTARARAEKPGHGIGLSLVALVARAHGASAVFLPSGRGAHLRVSFPHQGHPGAGDSRP